LNGTEQEHVREWRARRRERGEHRGLDRETYGRKQRRVGVDNADDAFDEDPSEKPGSYADDFFEVEASAG